MTPENHTLFDWNTLDEYSDLKRLQMVFTSLPAGGLLDALCHMRSGGGRNDWPLQPIAQSLHCKNRLPASVGGVVSPRTAAQSFADAGVWIQTDGLPQRPPALSGAVQERVFKIQQADESGRARLWRSQRHV